MTPFSVTVRPSRSSGWVNLRWAPSKSAEVLATYRANDKLLVIRELDNWYQAEDQDTGDVGFISKQFFFDSAFVFIYQAVGRIKDLRSAAVIPVHHNCMNARKVFIKFKQIADISSTPGINSLVRIPNNEKIIMETIIKYTTL